MNLRLRLTIVAVVLVGVAVAGGAAVLVSLLGDALTDQVCATARERAGEVANGAPATSGELSQVLGTDGADPVSGTVPRPGECRTAEPPGYDEDFAFAAATAEGRTVIVGEPLVDVLDSTGFLTRSLLIGLPMLLLIVGATTWYVVGRTLAPVTAIRSEAEQITAAGLDRRMPQPRGSDEIARLAKTMNRMLDRLERAQTAQRRFVSDASHELRSPVAAIRQHVEVALAHPDGTSLAELAGTVRDENLRIQRLVDDLLLLAKADEAGLTLPRATVDLDDLVFDEARRLRETGAVRVDSGAVSGGQVTGDPDSLRRMLRNLGENAAAYARGRVAFGLAETDGSVRLTVSDDGPGIPAGERDRVFERFVRLGAARGRPDGGTGGTGLGLAIVAEVVRAHGGAVRITEAPGGGTRVEVRLPATCSAP